MLYQGVAGEAKINVRILVAGTPQRQRVFDSQAQLIHYLDRLDLLARRYKVRIHAFCLMSNHVHFMFEQQQKRGISLLMQHLQSYHARFVNRLRRTDGHLWRHHFHAKHIENSRQYRNRLLYIEQNPTAARICQRAHRYAFSSAIAHTQNEAFYTVGRHQYKARVRLYLERWRKEFAISPDQPTDWPARLRSPRDEASEEDLAAFAPQDIEGKPLVPPHKTRPIGPAAARAPYRPLKAAARGS